MAESYETTISMLRSRIAELEAQSEYIRKRYQQLDLLIRKNILVMRGCNHQWQATGDAETGWRGFITRSSSWQLPDEQRKTHRHISTANMLRSMKSLWRFTSGFGNKARLNVPPLASRWSNCLEHHFINRPNYGKYCPIPHLF
jgi:hypothetical protein